MCCKKHFLENCDPAGFGGINPCLNAWKPFGLALATNARESDLSDFHKLRQDFSPHRLIAEQRAIVGRLGAIYQSRVETLEELKKSVLQKAFSGEL